MSETTAVVGTDRGTDALLRQSHYWVLLLFAMSFIQDGWFREDSCDDTLCRCREALLEEDGD